MARKFLISTAQARIFKLCEFSGGTDLKEIIWRLASTFEVYVLATGESSLSESTKRNLEEKFGYQLDKPRPWGLVMFENAVDSALVFSRTSDVSPPDSRNIRHPFHPSITCRLDEDGSLEYMKRMMIRRKLWVSGRNIVQIGSIKLQLVCPCVEPSCSKFDKTLKRALLEIAKSKPIILVKDAIGNGK
jgi:hypothetical protein